MKRISVLTALFVIASLGSVVSAGPIANLAVVQGFPGTIVAGSGYQAHYRFDNTAGYEVPVAFMFNFTNLDFPVNEGEVEVWMRLNSNDMDCSENEPGSFVCDGNGDEIAIGPGSTNDLFVNITSIPSLYPDTNYSLTMDLLGTQAPSETLFASGQGRASDGGRGFIGESTIFTDQARSSFRLMVKDRRSGREFSRTYSVVRHISWGFFEAYRCRDDLGRDFTITVIFRFWVHGQGRNINFFGRLA